MNIQKRGQKWRARYRGADGRERSRTFDRKADGVRWLAEQKMRLSRGEWIDPAASRVLFGTVESEWRAVAFPHLKPKTRAGYTSLLLSRVLPRWRTVRLDKITYEGLSEWVAYMLGEGLSASRVRQCTYIVSLVCEYAIRTGRLRQNPTAALRLPKISRSTERRFLTHREVGILADAVGQYRTFVLTLAYTGLRWGEAIALQVRDIDLTRRRLDVRRAFADVHGELIEGPPKSHQARTVPLPQWLCALLAARLEGKKPDALVFCTAGGYLLRYNNFRSRVWIPAIKTTGLAGLTPHGLRHTAASLYIAAGTPAKVVQRILGHGSVAITLDLYGHLYPDEMDTWADRLGEIASETMRPECGQVDPDDEGGGTAGILTGV